MLSMALKCPEMEELGSELDFGISEKVDLTSGALLTRHNLRSFFGQKIRLKRLGLSPENRGK